MDVEIGEVLDSSRLEPGTLFYRPNYRGEPWLCLAVVVEEGDEESRRRILPLTSPGDESSLNVLIYESQFRSQVLAIPDAIAIPDIASVTRQERAIAYGSLGSLYLPLRRAGYDYGYVDLNTGTYANAVPQPSVGFGTWTIVKASDRDSVIYEFGREE